MNYYYFSWGVSLLQPWFFFLLLDVNLTYVATGIKLALLASKHTRVLPIGRRSCIPTLLCTEDCYVCSNRYKSCSTCMLGSKQASIISVADGVGRGSWWCDVQSYSRKYYILFCCRLLAMAGTRVWSTELQWTPIPPGFHLQLSYILQKQQKLDLRWS